MLSDQIVYCWHCTVDDALILLHSDVSEFGMGGKKWCSRGSFKDLPSRDLLRSRRGHAALRMGR